MKLTRHTGRFLLLYLFTCKIGGLNFLLKKLSQFSAGSSNSPLQAHETSRAALSGRIFL